MVWLYISRYCLYLLIMKLKFLRNLKNKLFYLLVYNKFMVDIKNKFF